VLYSKKKAPKNLRSWVLFFGADEGVSTLNNFTRSAGCKMVLPLYRAPAGIFKSSGMYADSFALRQYLQNARISAASSFSTLRLRPAVYALFMTSCKSWSVNLPVQRAVFVRFPIK
jgi:hypothetical protein